MTLAHTSRVRIEKHAGPHRTAHLQGFDGAPLQFGVHGGIRHFYEGKYGKELPSPDRPATLDHIIAGVAGWLAGTLGAALDAREIASAENLVADVEGEIEDVDGVLKITRIRIVYRLQIPAGSRDKLDRALATYAEKCPAYQSVKGCIDVTWQCEASEA